jgi:hypothetical protein
MDETVLLKMLAEIDSMTSKEYWEFFNESQKLPDYLLDWEPVPGMAAIDAVAMFNGVSFSTDYKSHFQTFSNSQYSESGDTICLQAA